MSEGRSLLIGFDLCNDYSQISCFNNTTFEPETIKYNSDSEDELFSTVMALTKDTNEWLFGDDADAAIASGTADAARDIVKAVSNNENIKINDKEVNSIDILAIFFRKSLSLIKKYHPNDVILKMVVTIETTNMTLINGIFKALDMLGINRDRVSVQSHSQSYIYYALSQRKELWMNDVGLFHFDIDGLKYYQINLDRRHRPITVGVTFKDFSDTLSYELIEQNHEKQAQMLFENVLSTVFYKQIITTVYLTGKGFNGKWFENSIKSFGQGRRLFRGQNLFSEGACFAAREYVSGDKFTEFTIMNEDMISSSVSVNVYYAAKEQELLFVKMATPWYEADKTYDFILDNSNEIEVMVRNNLKNTKKSFIIVLDLMNARPNKTTRVRMRVKFVDAKRCIVTVKDLGFGDFYPGTNRVWEKIIEME